MSRHHLRVLKNRLGFSLVETLTAISIFTLITISSLSLVLAAAASYNRDIRRASIDTQNGLAMRRVADTLRESVSVVIDSDGNGMTFYLPLKTGNPPRIDLTTGMVRSDGVVRRIQRSSDGRSLFMTESAGRNIRIARNLAPYPSGTRMFSLLPSNKAVVVTLRTQDSFQGQTFTTAKTEVVRLRNL